MKKLIQGLLRDIREKGNPDPVNGYNYHLGTCGAGLPAKCKFSISPG